MTQISIQTVNAFWESGSEGHFSASVYFEVDWCLWSLVKAGRPATSNLRGGLAGFDRDLDPDARPGRFTASRQQWA